MYFDGTKKKTFNAHIFFFFSNYINLSIWATNVLIPIDIFFVLRIASHLMFSSGFCGNSHFLSLPIQQEKNFPENETDWHSSDIYTTIQKTDPFPVQSFDVQMFSVCWHVTLLFKFSENLGCFWVIILFALTNKNWNIVALSIFSVVGHIHVTCTKNYCTVCTNNLKIK